MNKKKKVIDFLASTTSNTWMNERQYNLFDKASNGLSNYKEQNGPIEREEYFDGEVHAWDDDEVNEFVAVFNL